MPSHCITHSATQAHQVRWHAWPDLCGRSLLPYVVIPVIIVVQHPLAVLPFCLATDFAKHGFALDAFAS